MPRDSSAFWQGAQKDNPVKAEVFFYYYYYFYLGFGVFFYFLIGEGISPLTVDSKAQSFAVEKHPGITRNQPGNWIVAATRGEILAKAAGELGGGRVGTGGSAAGPGLVALLAASFSGIQREMISLPSGNILIPP